MCVKSNLTLGSLFDGIGGFPYAALFFGIQPIWASEILPSAVSITKRHFPDMIHLGDITRLDGRNLPPVDVITFGSPCQGLSMAGRRLGLADERSGLFSEAIRIIREMQEETHGEYPKMAIWENVPGALSSAGGRDYQAVLEAFTTSKISMPMSGRWANSGMARGRGIDLAWCVYDAQYFGTAQRRRRVFLVADFTGRRAGEILFVPKSLRGYFAAGGTPRQGAPDYAGRGADSAIEILNDQGGDSISVERSGVSPTLRSETHGNLPIVANVAVFLGGQTDTARGVGYKKTVSPAPRASVSGTNMTPCVCEPTHKAVLCASTGQTKTEILENQVSTLNCNHEQPVLAYGVDLQQITNKDNRTFLKPMQPTLCATSNPHAVVHPQIAGTTMDAVAVDCRNLRETPEISGTLQAKSVSGGYSLNYQNPVRTGYTVRRLTPMECERLQGFPDGWTEYGHDGQLISDTKRYQMLGNSVAVPCVAYLMQGIRDALIGR